MGWLSVPIVTLVMFTLYGIEGIGIQLEDPFGYDRNDIKMDAIVDDARMEVSVMLDEWRRAQRGREGLEGEERWNREMFVQGSGAEGEGWGYVMR
jgi:ion channel-forming bestrophin family protein